MSDDVNPTEPVGTAEDFAGLFATQSNRALTAAIAGVADRPESERSAEQPPDQVEG